MDNHIIALEPFQRYNLGPFSWAYERLRLVNGKLFGYAGRSIHRFMEWYHSNHVGPFHQLTLHACTSKLAFDGLQHIYIPGPSCKAHLQVPIARFMCLQ